MLAQVRNTSEYNCRSLREQLFCPQDASPSGNRFLPLSCPVFSHMWLPQNLNLQARYHFKILKSIPAAAPSLPTTSVTQSWGFNTECPPHTQLCGPVIGTKCLVILEFPSWPFRCREPPATLAWPPSAFCCLYIDSTSAWSRPLGSTKCPNQAPSWFKCFWLQILWEFGDKKKIYLQMQFYIYWWVGAAFRPYEANLRLESQCGRSSVSHLVWGLHCSCLWTAMSLACQQYSFPSVYLISTSMSYLFQTYDWGTHRHCTWPWQLYYPSQLLKPVTVTNLILGQLLCPRSLVLGTSLGKQVCSLRPAIPEFLFS